MLLLSEPIPIICIFQFQLPPFPRKRKRQRKRDRRREFRKLEQEEQLSRGRKPFRGLYTYFQLGDMHFFHRAHPPSQLQILHRSSNSLFIIHMFHLYISSAFRFLYIALVDNFTPTVEYLENIQGIDNRAEMLESENKLCQLSLDQKNNKFPCCTTCRCISAPLLGF